MRTVQVRTSYRLPRTGWQGVLRLIDGERFGDAVPVSGIGVIPARVEFSQHDRVRKIAVDFVRRHVDERRFGRKAPRGFEQIQRGGGVGVEVVEGNRRGTVVRGLRRGVDYHVRTKLADQLENRRAIANVDRKMLVAANRRTEPLERPAGVAFGSEKYGALIVVDSRDAKFALRKIFTDRGPDQSARPRHQSPLPHHWFDAAESRLFSPRFAESLTWVSSRARGCAMFLEK